MLIYVTPKNVIKVGVTNAGRDAVKDVAERYGMKEYIVAGKILDWFAKQDDVYQREVLGLLEGMEEQAVRVYMERLASPRYPGPDENPFGHKGQHGESLTDEAMKATQGKGAAPPRDQSSKPPHKRGKH